MTPILLAVLLNLSPGIQLTDSTTEDRHLRLVDAPPAPEHLWYGAPGLGLDAAGVIFVAVGVGMEAFASPNPSAAYSGVADNLEGAGLAMLALGAPLNHLLNRHPGRAALSFLARLGTFSTIVISRETTKNVAPEIICAALFISVAVVDDVWFARDEVKRDTTIPVVSPWVDVKNQGGGLLVSGSF